MRLRKDLSAAFLPGFTYPYREGAWKYYRNKLSLRGAEGDAAIQVVNRDCLASPAMTAKQISILFSVGVLAFDLLFKAAQPARQLGPEALKARLLPPDLVLLRGDKFPEQDFVRRGLKPGRPRQAF
jgi:hypothetical protein